MDMSRATTESWSEHSYNISEASDREYMSDSTMNSDTDVSEEEDEDSDAESALVPYFSDEEDEDEELESNADDEDENPKFKIVIDQPVIKLDLSTLEFGPNDNKPNPKLEYLDKIGTRSTPAVWCFADNDEAMAFWLTMARV